MWRVVIFCVVTVWGAAEAVPHTPSNQKNRKLLWAYGADVPPQPSNRNTVGSYSNNFLLEGSEQNIHTILLSIEERLRNLESPQMEPTILLKLQQYHRKLDMIDVKINRLEELLTVHMDKISESISNKTYKEDLTRLNMYGKMDSIYEGLTYRLGYLERKLETNFNITHTKSNTIATRLEKMDDSIISRDSDIEAGISDAIFAVDDLKTSFSTFEENFANKTRNNLMGLLKHQEDFLNKTTRNVVSALENVTKNVTSLIGCCTENNKLLKNMKAELKQDFNEYANKVADMNTDVWKSSNVVEDDLKDIATDLKMLVKKHQNDNDFDDVQTLATLHKQLEENFVKILDNQEEFKTNCYRLQMDEPQIEFKISNTLEKLINMLEKKSAMEMKDTQLLEGLLKNHHRQMYRILQQSNSNIISLHDKSGKSHQLSQGEFRKINNNFDALFAVLQQAVTTLQKPATAANSQAFSQEISFIKSKLDETCAKTDQIATAIDLMKGSLQGFEKNSQSTYEYIKNIYHILNSIESKINKSYLDFYFNKYNVDEVAHRFGQRLGQYIKDVKLQSFNNDTKKVTTTVDTEGIILEIFGLSVDFNDTNSNEGNISTHEPVIDSDIKNNATVDEFIRRIFDNNKPFEDEDFTLENNQTKVNLTETVKTRCKQNLKDTLIFGDTTICEDDSIDDVETKPEENITEQQNLQNLCYDIDIRTATDELILKCKNKTKNETDEEESNLKNLCYDIDVRTASDELISKCKNKTKDETDEEESNLNNLCYDIDVRTASDELILKCENKTKNQTDEEEQNLNNLCYDIDVRTASADLISKCQNKTENKLETDEDQPNCFGLDVRNDNNEDVFGKCNDNVDSQQPTVHNDMDARVNFDANENLTMSSQEAATDNSTNLEKSIEGNTDDNLGDETLASETL